MSIVSVGLLANFLLLVGSWVFFFKFFERKDKNSEEKIYAEIDELKKGLLLVTKNPAAARRKLKSGE